MYQIFFMTPCNFMHAGLVALMHTASLPVQVCRISRPEEIKGGLQESGRRLILVSIPGNEPRVAALAEMFLWRLDVLQTSGLIPNLPCVLLSNDFSRAYRCLPERMPVEKLREALSEILLHPDKEMRNLFQQKGKRELSPLQKKILAGTLAGESVGEMAERLEIAERGIFAGRAALIRKLGLKNRLGLMALLGQKVGTLLSLE
ncbi:hypothetical protein ITK37_004642 [Salmonella enterica]|nr:hypothetical protein [Salmonella enterica]